MNADELDAVTQFGSPKSLIHLNMLKHVTMPSSLIHFMTVAPSILLLKFHVFDRLETDCLFIEGAFFELSF